MSTRSGKTYHEAKRLKKRTDVKDNFDTNTTPKGKGAESNLDISSMSSRELRSRRSSIKDSTFDKSNSSVTKNDIENATDSNWIISDLSNKVKRKKSNINTCANGSIASVTNGCIEQEPENDSEPTKRLRKRKSSVANNTYDKDDKIVNTTFDRETEREKTFVKDEIKSDIVKNKKKGKSKKSVKIDINLEKDTENDLNSPNVDGKQVKKKKKKVKGGKKKKVKGKPKEDVEDTALDKGDTIFNTTFEKDKDTSVEKINFVNDINCALNASTVSNKKLRSNKSSLKDTTFEKENKIVDTTFEKDENIDERNLESNSNTSKVNVTFDKNDNNNTFEKDVSTSFDTFKNGAKTRKSSINEVFNTSIHSSPKIDAKDQNTLPSPAVKKRKSLVPQTAELNSLSPPRKQDSTFDKTTDIEMEPKKASQSLSVGSTSKLNTTFDKEISKSSLISSDNSVVSRVSITSDESTDNIMNTTPVLIESSLEVSQVKETPKEAPKTPLKREGTFTKDSPEVQVQSPCTPSRSRPSLTPAAGCTPYHLGRSSQKKPLLNVTRSIEKRLSVEAPRLTRVMFCSPIDNPAIAAQEKRKIIKSNLKGSNKSFVFDESVSMSRPARKRSYTHSDVDDARVKRSRLADDLQQSVDRLSRPRTASTTLKQTETTPKKSAVLFKSKSETKPARTRLPNFAALHQRQFDKMESLGDCQERKAKRARQMLTPTGSTNVLDRSSPRNSIDGQKPLAKEPTKPKEKTDTPTKKLPTLDSLRPGFTRFGFKLNLDFNPFSVPAKTDKPKEKPNGVLKRPGVMPSVTGATSVRREVAKQTVMREKSFLSKRKINRSENRTIIKGVRTNRRFELQMKLRNVE